MTLGKQRGFTLIELLIVVGIVLVLTALLIPAIGSMRKSAATSRDASNLRQIGAAAFLFANDNNNTLPNPSVPLPGTRTSANDPDRGSFHEGVHRYMTMDWTNDPGSIFNWRGNPVWTSEFADPPAGFTPDTRKGQKRPNAYGFNQSMTNAIWGGRLQIIPSPATTVLAGEVNNASFVSASDTRVTQSNVSTAARMNRSGGALYLFCDGRVELIKGDQRMATLTASGAKNIWRWW